MQGIDDLIAGFDFFTEDDGIDNPLHLHQMLFQFRRAYPVAHRFDHRILPRNIV